MTHTGDVKVDEDAALAAATVLATINSAINPDPQDWLPDARDAVTAYLRAMAEKGERMMPRASSVEMADAARGLLLSEFRASPTFPLGQVLESMGRCPPGLTAEERALTHIPPKRWRADMIYRAMFDAHAGSRP